MNVERLHTISKALINDVTERNVVSLLANVSSSLGKVVSKKNQANTNYEEVLTSNLEQFKDACEKSDVNNFPPLWIQALNDLGFEGLLGKELSENVQALFDKNQHLVLYRLSSRRLFLPYNLYALLSFRLAISA